MSLETEVFKSEETGVDPVFANDFVSMEYSNDGSLLITVGTGLGAVALVRRSGKILMIRTPRYATGSFEWELPRGGSLEDESAVETAARCVEGWTGVTVDESSVIHLGVMNPDPELLTNEVSLLLLDTLNSTVRTNHENVKWVGIEELVAACLNGEIEDSFTCMAVLRARLNAMI